MYSRTVRTLFMRSAALSGKRMYSQQQSKGVQRYTKAFLMVAGVGGVSTALLLSGSAECSAPKLDIAAIRKDIAALIEREDAKRTDGSSLGPTLIRLAWHASGTYSAQDKTGGSNGATMRFAPESAWGANAGLAEARKQLEEIKKKHPEISYADLWTLAGAVAIEEAGGPSIPWRPGRTDSDVPTKVPDGRLPNADSGCPAADVAHIRAIFGRMGFSDRETVALIGAHSMGRCHTEASGYWGPWTRAESTFSNEFFRLLLEEKWSQKKTHKGKKWTGPAQFENPDGSLMMLPADMALLSDPDMKKYVELYAHDEAVFFKDFAAAFSKLMELGVDFPAPKKEGLFGLGFLGL